MKHIILFCFMCLYSSLVLAHETNEAFFKITEKENTIEVEAEFPWTMRNALIAYNPTLKDTASKTDFENTFIDYIKANLILKNNAGAILKFENFKELDNHGHTHQNSYLIVFNGTNVAEVTNTTMFNINQTQANYNSITSLSKTFKTTKASNHFKVNQKKYSGYWYLLILILPVLFLVYRFYNKKDSKS